MAKGIIDGGGRFDLCRELEFSEVRFNSGVSSAFNPGLRTCSGIFERPPVSLAKRRKDQKLYDKLKKKRNK